MYEWVCITKYNARIAGRCHCCAQCARNYALNSHLMFCQLWRCGCGFPYSCGFACAHLHKCAYALTLSLNVCMWDCVCVRVPASFLIVYCSFISFYLHHYFQALLSTHAGDGKLCVYTHMHMLYECMCVCIGVLELAKVATVRCAECDWVKSYKLTPTNYTYYTEHTHEWILNKYGCVRTSISRSYIYIYVDANILYNIQDELYKMNKLVGGWRVGY